MVRRAGTGEQGDGVARLGWLDALRGVAVLFVVWEHVTDHLLRGLRVVTDVWFNSGRTGVFLFFVISGYIVPASLERRGDLRRFWVGRVFRLYPMMVVGTGATLVLAAVGAVALDPQLVRRGWAAGIASVVMLQDVLGLPSTPAVLWSLSYEMLFYLLVSALFVWGWHRASAGWSVLCAGVAAGVGGVLPVVRLSAVGVGPRGGAVLVVLAVVVGVGGLVSGRRWLVVAGSVGVGGLVLLLLLTSDRFPGWYLFSIPAVMFAGTAMYRVHERQVGWLVAAPALGVVFVLVTGATWWALSSLRWAQVRTTGPWVGTMVAVAVAFGVGVVLRRRRWPRLLVRLGLISYSVYVVHYVLILWWGPVLDRYAHRSIVVQVVWVVGFVAAVVGVSEVTFRVVERPAQRAGRRLARLLERWPVAGVAPPGRVVPGGPAPAVVEVEATR